MKLVVTGSDGNLGRHVIEQAGNYNLEILPVNRASWENIDNIMEDCDAVLHAAGDIQTSVTKNPNRYLESNILTSSKLLELCVKHSVSKFYFISSCAVYGDVNRTNESQQCYPISINGKLKKLNEDVISDFCKSNGINFSCLRVFNLFGGDDRFSIVNYLTKAARDNAAFFLNNDGLSQRDFIHVSDVAEIILKIILKNKYPSLVNVGTGKAIKIIDLLNVVLEKYPDMRISRTFNEEIEYSRADITMLSGLVEKEDFISISNFVKDI